MKYKYIMLGELAHPFMKLKQQSLSMYLNILFSFILCSLLQNCKEQDAVSPSVNGIESKPKIEQFAPSETAQYYETIEPALAELYKGEVKVVMTDRESVPTEFQGQPSWKYKKLTETKGQLKAIYESGKSEADLMAKKSNRERNEWLAKWDAENQAKIRGLNTQLTKLLKQTQSPKPAREKIDNLIARMSEDSPIFQESDVYILQFLLRQQTQDNRRAINTLKNDQQYIEMFQLYMGLSRQLNLNNFNQGIYNPSALK